MWQVARRQSMKNLVMLEDFVSLVTETVPQLLTDRQRSLLLLALRAKVNVWFVERNRWLPYTHCLLLVAWLVLFSGLQLYLRVTKCWHMASKFILIFIKPTADGFYPDMRHVKCRIKLFSSLPFFYFNCFTTGRSHRRWSTSRSSPSRQNFSFWGNN